MNDTILISDIIVEDRIRTDLGDIDKLCDSIKEFGIIQPIVLNKYNTETGNGLPFTGTFLIAGGRRLVAMKRLGIKELEHGKHFVWRDEYDPLRRKAVELEENIRRKELTWQEQLNAKQRLFDLMQQIHGKPITGRPRISDNSGGVGFGINKLASMLGESVGTTSTDLKIARAIQQMPQLRFSQTKAQAITTLGIIATAGNMAVAGKAAPKTDQL
ncbi:MAG: ParB N-terminal domain-containing protein, partial [Candidatus Acidiferrales bacterium]